MATTFTPNLTLPNPTPADPSVTDAWGTLENTARTLLDTAVAGILTLSVAGNSNVILTSNTGAPDQSRNRAFVFTGLLTGNITIFWPQGLNRFFTVTNSTSGAFTVTLAVNNGSGSPAGTTFAIAQGTSLSFQSDGTNITATANAPGGPAGGDLTGAYPNPTIAASAVTSSKIASGAAATNVGALSGDLSGNLPSPTVAKVNGNSVHVPTVTVLTSGSGTYTPPAGCIRIFVRMVGGGGGGGGTGGNGGTGGATTLGGALSAGGGAGGATVSGGTGAGVATGGDLNLTGMDGQTAGGVNLSAGSGGNSPFGGAGGGALGAGNAGQPGRTNTGAGGGGGNPGGGNFSSGGGQSGGYLEKLITSLAANYAYAVGASGLAGAAGGGVAGGAGASGLIVIQEFYY